MSAVYYSNKTTTVAYNYRNR